MNEKLNKEEVKDVAGGTAYTGWDCRKFVCKDCGAEWVSTNNNGIGIAYHTPECKNDGTQAYSCGMCKHYVNYGCEIY